MSEILFVTSFNYKFYKASAEKLLRSFREHQKTGRILCCYENFPPGEHRPWEINGKNVLGYKIDQDPFLVRWDKRFKEKCTGQTSYWNRRAWGWYRKVVSLRFAKRYYHETDWLIWIDCDSEFRDHCCDLERLIQWQHPLHPREPAVFHFTGRREWTETGCMLYDLRHPFSHAFLEEFFRVYESGDFLKLERWDDCWVFDDVKRRLAEERGNIPTKDLTASKDVKLRVLENSPIGKFLIHYKGSHGKKGVLK